MQEREEHYGTVPFAGNRQKVPHGEGKAFSRNAAMRKSHQATREADNVHDYSRHAVIKAAGI